MLSSIYLTIMTFIASSPIYQKHRTGFGHPECPERAFCIDEALKKAGLFLPHHALALRAAKEEEVLLCHTKEYVDLVKKEVELCGRGLRLLSTGDAVISSDSCDVATYAVGAVLQACDAVMEKKAKNAFCIVRPPGHHATATHGMGFCIFNNVAIGARYVQRRYKLKRVLIIDWDVHHGNGTQDIFDADPSVFYFSTHQAGIYPGTGKSSDCGLKMAQGTKMNYPIPAGPNSKEAIFKAFSELLASMEKFHPDFVFISCGFDAHQEDPLGGFNLTDSDFYDLTLIVKKIAEKYAEGRLVSVLEGGYNLNAIARASVEHVRALSTL